MILIIGTIVIYNQLDYVRSRKIGYDREHVLVLHNTENLDKQIHTFRKELLRLPGVEQASISGDLPTAGSGNLNQRGWFRDAGLNAKNIIILTSINVDENYIPALGMQIEKGRNFSKEYKTDSTGIILNETAAAMLGWKDLSDAKLYLLDDNKKPLAFHVIGIVKDFNSAPCMIKWARW
jgi:putative ABC transport system permease protein